MSTLVQIGLSNALFAAGLAVLAFVVTRIGRNRHVAHALWLLVLVKLVTPPIWHLPLPRVAQLSATAADSDKYREAGALERAGVSEGHVDSSARADGDASPTADLRDMASLEEASVPSELPGTSAPSPDLRSAARVIAADQSVRDSSGKGFIVDGHAVRVLAWSWIATSAFWALVGCVRIVRFSRRVAIAAEPASDALRERAEQLALRFGLRRKPELRLVEGNVSPMLWPLASRPLILVPRRLVESLTLPQLDTVIAHELAHVARRDELVRFVEAAVTALYWWNPIVWWARRELHAAEEDCCDSLVVATLPDARRAYGEALLHAGEMIAFGRSSPALASTFGLPGHSMQSQLLKRRIEMILDHELPRSASWPARLGMLALAVVVLPLAATAMSDEGRDQEPVRVSPHMYQWRGESTTPEAGAAAESARGDSIGASTFARQDVDTAPDGGTEAKPAPGALAPSTYESKSPAGVETETTAVEKQTADRVSTTQGATRIEIVYDPVAGIVVRGPKRQVETLLVAKDFLLRAMKPQDAAETDESKSRTGAQSDQMTLSDSSVENLDELEDAVRLLLNAINTQSASGRVSSFAGGGYSGGTGGAAFSTGSSSLRQRPDGSFAGGTTQSGSNFPGGGNTMAANLPEPEIAELRKALKALAAALEARKAEGFPPRQSVQRRPETPWSYYYGSTGHREPTESERAAYEYELRLLELDIAEQKVVTDKLAEANALVPGAIDEHEVQLAQIQLQRAETKLDLFKAQHPEFNRKDEK